MPESLAHHSTMLQYRCRRRRSKLNRRSFSSSS